MPGSNVPPGQGRFNIRQHEAGAGERARHGRGGALCRFGRRRSFAAGASIPPLSPRAVDLVRYVPALLNSPRRRCVSFLKDDGIYAILDAGIMAPGNLVDSALKLAKAGVRVFQLRAKEMPDFAFLELGLRVKSALRSCVVLINDRVDIAIMAKADGVHLGQDDIPVAMARRALGAKKAVGVSAGSFIEAARAIRANPDYVSLGPAFPTTTKSDAGKHLGLSGIVRLARKIPGKLIRVAVGGITADNVGIILRCRIEAVAVASGLLLGRKGGREAYRVLQAVKAAKAVQREQCGRSGSAMGCGGRIG